MVLKNQGAATSPTTPLHLMKGYRSSRTTIPLDSSPPLPPPVRAPLFTPPLFLRLRSTILIQNANSLASRQSRPFPLRRLVMILNEHIGSYIAVVLHTSIGQHCAQPVRQIAAREMLCLRKPNSKSKFLVNIYVFYLI